MSQSLPGNLRKLTLPQRRSTIADAFAFSPEESAGIDADSSMLDLADIMVESAIGVMPVPLGVATGFLIDGAEYLVPLAVEEPSVIAASSYAAGIVRRAGGFRTWATEPVMSAQVVLEGRYDAESVMKHEPEVRATLEPILAAMERRGGGYRGMDVEASAGCTCVMLHVDVRNAMGANLLNTAAEAASRVLSGRLGTQRLMAILTNAGEQRRAGAECSIPVQRLARAGFSGEEAARRIALGAQFARENYRRAVTHNKEIMNGVTSLALATGNDTRGIEAAVHAWASRDGVYRGLTEFSVVDGNLIGRWEAPLPFGVVGGAVAVHPAARAALKILGNPDAVTLSRIAAAVGLAQNLAAVYALVTEGIQSGHMRLHCERLAFLAGARGTQIREVAALLAAGTRHNLDEARVVLSQVEQSAYGRTR